MAKKDIYNLDKVGKQLVKKLKKELSKYGLGNSDLAKSIKYTIKDNKLTLEMNEYGIYLDSGTNPRDKMPPYDAINKWAKPLNLNTWAVMYSIRENGIDAKPFLHILDNSSDIDEIIIDSGYAEFEIYTDDLFEKAFNVKIQ